MKNRHGLRRCTYKTGGAMVYPPTNPLHLRLTNLASPCSLAVVANNHKIPPADFHHKSVPITHSLTHSLECVFIVRRWILFLVECILALSCATLLSTA